MRLVTFAADGRVRLGAEVDAGGTRWILELNRARPELPADLVAFLAAGPTALERARAAVAEADTATLLPSGRVTLLAPIPQPGKILCVGHNYHGHIGIGRVDLPEYPNLFCKTANTVIGPGQPIVLPAVTRQVDYEAELAVVIGTRGHEIPEAEALRYVGGYTIFNDVSARDYQKRGSQWFAGKSFDTFGPLGPALVTPDEVPDPHSLALELRVNGVPCQRGNTQDLIFNVPFLVSYLSQIVTLEPGDIIATGTPAKLPEAADPQRFLQPGDVVEITMAGLGTLSNPVAGPAQ